MTPDLPRKSLTEVRKAPEISLSLGQMPQYTTPDSGVEALAVSSHPDPLFHKVETGIRAPSLYRSSDIRFLCIGLHSVLSGIHLRVTA